MSSVVKLKTFKVVFQQHVRGGGQGKREVGDERREGEVRVRDEREEGEGKGKNGEKGGREKEENFARS